MKLYFQSACSSLLALAVLAVAVMFLGGCEPPIPLTYSPSSVLSASGTVGIAAFRYVPAETGRVAPNQIRNTAIGNLKFDQNIDAYVRDSILKELRFIGIKIDGKERTLSGEIQEFSIDDLGYSMDLTLKIHYVVKRVSDGTSLYDSEKTIQRKTSKFVNQMGSLNETIKLNVDEMVKDEAFIKAIN
jgi:hypothetical protein